MPHNTQAPRQGTHRLLDILDKDITTSTPRATRHTHKGTQALREKPSVVRHNTRNKLRDIHAQITPTHANTHPPRDPDLLTHTVTSTTPVTETHRVTETHSAMDTYSHICMYVHIPAAETQRSAHTYKEEVSSLIPRL